MRVVCALLGQVPDAGNVSAAGRFCSSSVNVMSLAWSHGESGLAPGSRLETEAGREDQSEVQGRKYWHGQPQECQERSQGSRARAA